MPTLNHLTCQILDGITEEPLQEWGQQTLKKVDGTSCFVQADTGRPFSIKITHDMPFPPVQEVTAQAEDIEREKYQKVLKRDHSPYHLVGTLRFDGHTKPEKRCIVYLDQNHKYFKTEQIMDGRHALGADGNLWWHRWVFNEVGLGIDTLLDEMSLATSGKEGEKKRATAEDELVGLLDCLDTKGEEKEEASKAGLLEIIFERCTVAEKTYWEEYKPERDENIHDHGEKAGKNISHTAGRDASSKKEGKKMHYITYDTHAFPDEKPFATFQFKYRSEDVLRKFDFAGFPQKAIVPDVDMGKLDLTPIGGKRRKSNEDDDDSDDEYESPSKQKKITLETSKDDKREAGFVATAATAGDTKRMKMENEEAFFSEWKKHQAPKRVSTGDSDKENEGDASTENGTETASKNPKKKVVALGLSSRSMKEKLSMPTSEAIRSTIDQSEEKLDDDEKEMEMEQNDGLDEIV